MKKKVLAVLSTLMAGAMVFGMAGCKPKPDNGGNNPGGDTKPPAPTEMSLYERADYLARAVDDHYNTYEDGELFAAGYYNALEGDTDGLANCYEG